MYNSTSVSLSSKLFSKHGGSSHRSKKGVKSNTASSSSQQGSPPLAFLFVVNEFQFNEHGEAPSADLWGSTVPPRWPVGYGEERPGTVFRFKNGEVRPARGYSWHRAEPGRMGFIGRDEDDGPAEMERHSTTSVFNCWRFLPCIWTNTDSSITPMDTINHKWFPLAFHNVGGVTRIQVGGRDRTVAGRSPQWMPHVIPKSFATHSSAPSSQGLGGPLGVIIGLMALSHRNTDHPFMNQCWSDYQWSGVRDPGAGESC